MLAVKPPLVVRNVPGPVLVMTPAPAVAGVIKVAVAVGA